MEDRFKILISDAARAQELFDLDELEQYAKEMRQKIIQSLGLPEKVIKDEKLRG